MQSASARLMGIFGDFMDTLHGPTSETEKFYWHHPVWSPYAQNDNLLYHNKFWCKKASDEVRAKANAAFKKIESTEFVQSIGREV